MNLVSWAGIFARHPATSCTRSRVFWCNCNLGTYFCSCCVGSQLLIFLIVLLPFFVLCSLQLQLTEQTYIDTGPNPLVKELSSKKDLTIFCPVRHVTIG